MPKNERSMQVRITVYPEGEDVEIGTFEAGTIPYDMVMALRKSDNFAHPSVNGGDYVEVLDRYLSFTGEEYYLQVHTRK